MVTREIDRVFGDGRAAAHPEFVVAIVHAASGDWAARKPRMINLLEAKIVNAELQECSLIEQAQAQGLESR